ncbi:rCG36884 [Rattus norvegicus]|uniref:RCG36884 n=1 Tax=Rattus norvegicus TaxID=10116 RepID=A6HU85_RAT|nr:rCG36884 [Rattus norvegicus]
MTVNEWTEVSARAKTSRQRKKVSFFHVLYIGSQKKVWPRLKVHLPSSKIQIRSRSSHCKLFN